MDWNNDGKKDLLTGENSGNIRIYLNTNTDADPAFNGFTYLQLAGVNYDCGSYSVPWIVDWNNDGLPDVLCGDSNGTVQLMLNEGTPGAPLFNTKEFLKDGFANLDPGSTVSPAAADLDRDGNKDLIVGDASGNIFFYRNIGADELPVFSGWSKLKAGGAVVDVENYARVCVADWNNDGVIDILSGNRNYNAAPSGGVFFFDCVGPLSFNMNSISAGAGGAIRFTLDAGAANAGRTYYILGSVTGTEPGTPLPGGYATLPLNWDIFTDIALSLINTAFFNNFYGTLNADGVSVAVFNTNGPLPSAVGVVMNFAYTLTSPYDFVSNGGCMEFTP